MKNDNLLNYYEKGWELNLLKLCEDKYMEFSHFKFRILAAIDFINIKEEEIYSIIDMACGVGTTSILINNKYSNTYFTCVDISKVQIEAGYKYVQSKGKGDKFEFIVGDVCKPIKTSKKYYDYVIACEIIEHLPDPSIFLDNIINYSNNSTKFIFSVPIGVSKSNLCYRVVEENGSSIVVYDPLKIDKNKKYYEFYHKLYTFKEAVELFKKTGFKIDKYRGTTFLSDRQIGYYMNKITNYSYRFDKIINQLTFNRFAGNLVLLCTR